MLVRTVENDSSSLRRYMLGQRSTDYQFLALLVKRSKEETNTAYQTCIIKFSLILSVLNLISDVFTNLIGSELFTEGIPEDFQQSWTLFYDKFAHEFFSPLFEEVPPRA